MSDHCEDAEYELEMPFVTCASNGGPHDDDSFVAGWMMAELDTLMESLTKVASAEGILVREDCRPQADLIAMKHGWVAEFRNTDTDQWLWMDLAAPGEEA